MCGIVVRGRKNPLYYGLPDRLRQARKRAGLTMTTASLVSGLSNEAASQIEQRQRLPRIDTVERLAATLGVSPAWLAFGEGDEAASSSAPAAKEVGLRIASKRQERGLTRQALGSAFVLLPCAPAHGKRFVESIGKLFGMSDTPKDILPRGLSTLAT